MSFLDQDVAACTAAGIDVEDSYRAFRLEVALGGPVLDRLLATIERPNGKTRSKVRHGTRSGYTTMKCRCQLCRAANAAYARKQRCYKIG